MKYAELCAGYGGLGLAVEEAFPGAELAWYSEFEDAPSKIMAAHWPGVPNHGDMTTVDWAAVELSDELVLVAMAKEDSVKTLAATVDTLVADGMQEKLARGVLLLTEPPLASKNRKAHLELLERTREHFSEYVRSVVVLPFDPALDNGGPIVYQNLSTQSKEAWLMAAAEIMAGL